MGCKQHLEHEGEQHESHAIVLVSESQYGERAAPLVFWVFDSGLVAHENTGQTT